MSDLAYVSLDISAGRDIFKTANKPLAGGLEDEKR
jgi:hypothetical protein